MAVDAKPRLEAQREVWGQTLVELGKKRELFTKRMNTRFENAYPERFLQMGIAEQNMMGVAAGLATVGFVPWLSSFAVFLTSRTLDQLRMVVAQPKLNVKLGAGYAGIMTSKTGRTHQEVGDVAVMRAMPNMTIIAPADGPELRGAMAAMMEDSAPTYLRLTRDATPVIFDDSHAFEIGHRVYSNGVRCRRNYFDFHAALDRAQLLERLPSLGF